MKKFADDLNTAVFTTKYILDGASPILFVFHDEDGYWQFSAHVIDLPDEDYRIVALEEIINLDKTVLEVADLPYNMKASRSDRMSPWIIEDM